MTQIRADKLRPGQIAKYNTTCGIVRKKYFGKGRICVVLLTPTGKLAKVNKIFPSTPFWVYSTFEEAGIKIQQS